MDGLRLPISASVDRGHLLFDRYRVARAFGQNGHFLHAPILSPDPYDPPVLPPVSADCRMASVFLRLPVS
jgi:hypothetical protein